MDGRDGALKQERARQRPFVSVVVPARNEEAHISACVQALLEQTYPSELIEIIVAEGASVDATREILEGLANANRRLRVVDNPSGRTPDALNAAVMASRGDLIARMDAHSLPASDYVERCTQVLEASGAWCVGGRLIKTGSGKVGRAIATASSSRFGVGDSAFHYLQRPEDVESVFPGFWPRVVFERVGLFDPELSRNQDEEFSFRIRKAGGTIRFDPSIVVEYRSRSTLAGLFSQHRQYGMWKIRVFQKHPRAMRWRHVVPPLFVAAVVGGVVLASALRSPQPLAVSAAAVAAYLLAASLVALGRRGQGVQPTQLMAAFACMHVGYGIGIWMGLARFGLNWLRPAAGVAIPRLATRQD